MRRLVLTILFLPVLVLARPLPVEVHQDASGHWQLLRDGEPYFIKGAGGDQSLEMLAAAGGNTIRTWADGPAGWMPTCRPLVSN